MPVKFGEPLVASEGPLVEDTAEPATELERFETADAASDALGADTAGEATAEELSVALGAPPDAGLAVLPVFEVEVDDVAADTADAAPVTVEDAAPVTVEVADEADLLVAVVATFVIVPFNTAADALLELNKAINKNASANIATKKPRTNTAA